MKRRLTTPPRRRGRTALVAVMALWTAGTAGLTSAHAADQKASPAAASLPGRTQPIAHRPAMPGNLVPLPSGYGLTAADQAAMKTAADTARRSGKQTVVDSLTTPVDAVVAEPSGAFMLAANPQPVRVRRGHGWTPVDLKLTHQAGGGWAPAATAYGTVTFSGGGRGPLAVTRSGATSIALTWPTALPAPVVDGASATYRSVLPGVDLVMSATADGGLSDVLVIHSAQAAKRLASVRLTTSVHGGKLGVARDGGLAVTDSRGALVADGATPVQWDSNTQLPDAAGRNTRNSKAKVAADRSDAGHPGLAARLARVKVSAAPGSLTLVPDARMLASRSTVWPVYADPSVNWHPVTGGTAEFDEVKQGCPGNSFTNQTGSLADNGYLGVGYNGWPEGSCYTGDEHAIYQWKLPKAIWGSDVHSAEVDATDIYSASCATTATVNLHWSKGMGSGTDWSNRPGYNSYSTSASFGPSYNPTYCPNNGSTTNGFNVLTPVKSSAAAHASTFTVTLSEDSLESKRNDLGFKRFTHNPTLQIFFNNAPNAPTAGTMAAVAGADDAACDTVSPYPYMGKTIATTPPVLRAKVSDPNADKLQATFQYWINGQTTMHTVTSGDNLSSGTYATASLTSSFMSSLTNGTTVDWNVKVTDGMDSTSYTQSPTCHFTAEPTAPDTPAVTSEGNLYPNTDVTDAVVGATYGTAGKFDIAGAGTAATKFVYNLDVPPTKVNPPAAQTVTAASNAATVTVTPPSPGPHTLWVYAVDAAGDASGDFAYPFLAAGHTGTTCASLAACFNNTAISSDTATTQADIDGSGDSFSATDLAGAGWPSAGKVTVDGASFTLPAFGAGQKDNVLAANQTVTYSGSGSALEFLATSTNAGLSTPGAIDGDSTAPYVPAGTAVSGSYCFSGTDPVGACAATGTINYTDGSSTTYDLTVPNWWDVGTSLPAVVLPHRNDTTGSHASPHGLFAFSVPIDPARTIASVTLPDVSNHVGNNTQTLHIFGMSTRDTTKGTPEANGTYSAAASGQSWTGAWANPNESNSNLLAGGVNYSNQTFRTALQPSMSGTTVRIKLDNGEGTSKLSIGHTTVALSSSATSFTSVPTGTIKSLTFGGSQSVTVPAGGMVYSDPVSFTVTAGHLLLVSYQLTNSVPYVITHSYANGSYSYVSAVGSGDLTTGTSATPFTTNAAAYGNFTQLVAGLDVQGAGVPTEAVLGDHLVDPFQPNTTPPNSNGYRVSDALAGAEPTTPQPFGVLAEGIESNQLMSDNPEQYQGNAIGGPAVLSRIDRDVLDQPGINTVVLDEGLEDLLGGSTTNGDLEDNGYTALVQQLQAWGINVVLTSLTPCQGFNGDGATANDPCTSTVDDARTDVNAFLGGMNLGNPWSTPAVYFADFDTAVAAPNAYRGEERLAPWADSGDHVNLSLAAYGALADSLMTPQDTWNADDGGDMPVATDTAATDTPQTPGTILNPGTGNAPLTLSATGATWADDSLRGTVLTLDGATGTATSSTPVLNTQASFSVSAWVKLPSLPTRNMTIAAQEGTQNSSFLLQYNYAHATAPGWALSTTSADTSGPAFTFAYASGATANTWTHLVGVYNAAAKTTQLYVNGTLAGSATGVTLWNAPDAYTVGRALYNGSQTDFLSGSVSGVQSFDYAVTGNQASALYRQNIAGGGPYAFSDTVDFDGDGIPDVVAQTASGDLWMFPGDGGHAPATGAATLVGWGFSAYTVAGIADFNGDGYQDIVARDSTGLLWLYPGDAAHDTSTARVEIGTGWSTYTFAGVRDWNGDGHPDVVAEDSSGALWMYPSSGTVNGTSTLGTRVKIGSSWTTYTLEGMTDWDNDGHMDLVAMDSTGLLWLYPGDAAHDTSTARVQIGTGWTNYTVAGLPDWDGDGKADIVTRGPGGLLWMYPGPGTRAAPGTRRELGIGW